MNQFVINGNNIDLLKNYPDNYFDAIVTDPPYGLGKEPNAEEVMKGWIEKGYHEVGGSGFMGKEWDAFIPQPIFWKEVFRVLKHGGHVVSFFGTRTYDWGVMAMRFAGFEVRDCIQWLYGSGFPKSYNVAKGIEGKIVNGSSSWNDWKNLDGEKEEVNWGYSKGQAQQGYRADYSEANKERVGKVNFQTEEGKKWEGWGSALKPANEPIVLARKPLEKGLSIAENVLKWGTGGINIDGCRISTDDKTQRKNKGVEWGFRKEEYYENREDNIFGSTQGRFPANLILTHHPECECKGLKKVKPSNGSGKASENGGGFSKGMFGDGTSDNIGGGFTDENGEETVEDWECHPDCPIKIMDEQSGISISGKNLDEKGSGGIWQKSSGLPVGNQYGDKGGASRFFYCAKASKSERNKGLSEEIGERKTPMSGRGQGGLKCKNCNKWKNSGNPCICQNSDFEEVKFDSKPNFNGHPTVKPVKLMQYLVRLITPPNGKVLDPFCGSGTTGIACKLEGFEFIGLEQDAEYSKIAQSRIDNYEEEIEEIVYITNKEGEKVQITQTSLF